MPTPHRPSLLLFAAAGLMLAASACAPAAQSPAPAAGLPLPPGTPVATAGMTAAAPTYRAVGTVQSRTTAVLAARVSGYVTAVHVKLGDRVRAGQVLVVLATPEAGDQVAQARAGLAAARSQLQAAERQVAAAHAQAQLAASTLRRYQQLQQSDSVSPHEFDQVAAANRSAAADEAAARARQSAAASLVAQAQAALAQARSQAGFATLRAPFAAVVTAKSVAVGDLATPGAPLLSLEAPGQFQLAVSAPDQIVPALRLGLPVEATVASLPGPAFHVRIAEIAPSSDPAARAAIVKVDLPASPGLRSGLYGQVLLPAPAGAAPPSALTVPSTAVLQAGELDEMYVLDAGGRAELRLVKTGATAAGQVEILAGLSPGERYAVDAQAVANPEKGNHVR
ncbi:MAG TPA: efflux RND transporter periplasmic adaptor subunit [Terriglobales bacterium]|nr:efflux RND transporter periplasmic adaptor subunit [Terriglobales bacterium]